MANEAQFRIECGGGTPFDRQGGRAEVERLRRIAQAFVQRRAARTADQRQHRRQIAVVEHARPQFADENQRAVFVDQDALRLAVVQSQRQSWTYTEIQFLDGRVSPGLIVGAPLLVPTVGPYELYYLFPLTQEQLTLAQEAHEIHRLGAAVDLGLSLIHI